MGDVGEVNSLADTFSFNFPPLLSSDETHGNLQMTVTSPDPVLYEVAEK